MPAITPHSLWHGYSLGDWNDSWEQFARNAVGGAWEKNGDETWMRRRGGLAQETPVRTVEKADCTLHCVDNTGILALRGLLQATSS